MFCLHSVFVCFVRISEQTAIISLYSTNCFNPLQPSGHYMYRQFNIHNSTFCSHTLFVCFVWISEQTAIIYLHSINWLVFINDTECLLRGTGCIFIYN